MSLVSLPVEEMTLPICALPDTRIPSCSTKDIRRTSTWMAVNIFTSAARLQLSLAREILLLLKWSFGCYSELQFKLL